MISWKAVLLGFILTLIFAFVLNPFIGEFGSFIGIIVAGLIVGYLVNKNVTNGAIHGALIGVIGGFLAIIILLLIGGLIIIRAEIFGLLIRLIIDMALGAFGGIMGALAAGNRN